MAYISYDSCRHAQKGSGETDGEHDVRRTWTLSRIRLTLVSETR